MRSLWTREATLTKAATTAETLTFTSDMLPWREVAAFQIRLTGTDDDIDSLTRIRVKAGSHVIWDTDEVHFEALLQRITPGHTDYVAADTSLTIPFFDPRVPGLAKFTGQFPWQLGEPSVEIVTDATGGVGTVGISALLVKGIPMTHYHSFLAKRMEVAASSTNAGVAFSSGGGMKGFTINTTGLDRIIMTLPGLGVVVMGIGTSLIECERIENSDVRTNPLAYLFDREVPAPIGSELVLATGAGFVGAANELGLWAKHDLEAAA